VWIAASSGRRSCKFFFFGGREMILCFPTPREGRRDVPAPLHDGNGEKKGILKPRGLQFVEGMTQNNILFHQS